MDDVRPRPAGPRWPAGTLLSHLGDDDRDALIRAGTPRSVDRGEFLIHAGAPDTRVILLLDGCVRVVGSHPDGRTGLLAVRAGGDLVGEFAALDGEPRSASVVTAVPSALRLIDAGTFGALLLERPRIAIALARSLSAKLRTATRHRVDAGADVALVRLARVIDHLADQYGRPIEAGLLVDVPLSRPDLAALAAVAEPSAHRALRHLRDRGAVTTGYRRLVVTDRAALRAVGAGAQT